MASLLADLNGEGDTRMDVTVMGWRLRIRCPPSYAALPCFLHSLVKGQRLFEPTSGFLGATEYWPGTMHAETEGFSGGGDLGLFDWVRRGPKSRLRARIQGPSRAAGIQGYPGRG